MHALLGWISSILKFSQRLFAPFRLTASLLISAFISSSAVVIFANSGRSVADLLTRTGQGGETSSINPRKSITLPRLKVLSWDHDDLPWANILFQHLNAPALEELRWNNMLLDEDWNEENLEVLREFCQRLPPSLETIMLQNLSSGNFHLLELLPGDFGLRQLVFGPKNPLWAVKNVLSWLTEQNYWDEEGSHVGPFVDLTHISIDIDQSDKTYGWVHAVEEDFAQIVDIVCRRAVPGKSLLLEFSFRPHTYSEEAFSERALEALSKRELIISFEEDPDK
ncbi:hypothetical protein NP233_g9472 [Leucocoprinus birnbaumii]|uniref:Uncharacterized protein n=1 Tax=Leucocoprinus birnbaumii TaxID=56174 RepID=A0AAD5VKD7_9AGAR|nr:hypothetical protein NP233_g9472 [Leucocoprinus birnbaumii]